MPPEGYHDVRRHIRRNPRPRTKKTSGWVVAAALVGVLWLWGHGGTSSASTSSPSSPAPTASSAGR